jgi:hypothetical protein
MASGKTIPRTCKQCGAGFLVSAYDAARGRGIFCGTHCSAMSVGMSGTHHRSNTPIYKVYCSMLERCASPSNRSYENYGGRGITVCERWKGPSGFTNFITDMGERPPGMTIERKENTKGYSPDNCVWATRAVQGGNKRNNVLLTYQGRTQHLTAWSRELNITRNVIRLRLRKGYPPEVALIKGRLPPHIKQASKPRGPLRSG